jgi:hypothetical protein
MFYKVFLEQVGLELQLGLFTGKFTRVASK